MKVHIILTLEAEKLISFEITSNVSFSIEIIIINYFCQRLFCRFIPVFCVYNTVTRTVALSGTIYNGVLT
jgi:hypothetical protein